MKKSSQNGFEPGGAALSAEDLRRFGFAGADELWLSHLHEASCPDELGSIGAFELIEEVSRGGQGVVWRARQPGLRRDIALKRLIAGHFATRSMRRRFEREMQAASMLHHPGIVTVYGMEEVDGVPLLAMEWVEGRPITEWAAGRARDEVLTGFLRVCDAVEHAHHHGILHRDLKPSNVLVDEHDRPRVLDFGLAKSVDAERDSRLTESGGFLGTPGYAAPEQIEGGRARTDVRSDVFALGVLLYELLTGQRPYRPEQGIRAYLEALDADALPRPSRVAPSLDAEIDAILLEALASDPAQRYPSVTALADDLRRYLAGEPVRAHPPTTWYELRKLVRRNRVAAALSLALLTTIVLFGALTLRQAVVIAAERDAEAEARASAERAGERARHEATKAQAVLDFLLDDMIDQAGPRITGEELKLTDVLEHAVETVDERFGEMPEAEAMLHKTIAAVYMRMGRYEDAADQAALASERLEGVPFVDASEHYDAALIRGRALAHLARPEEAEEAYRSALEIAQRGAEPRTSALIEVRVGLADCKLMAFEYPAALEEFARLVEQVRRELPDDWELLAMSLRGLAVCRAQLGLIEEARAGFEETVELLRRNAGTEDVRYVDALAWLGDLDKLAGRRAEAIEKWTEVLAVHARIYGREHPKSISSIGNLGDLLCADGRLEEAVALLEEAVAGSTVLRGAEDPVTRMHAVRLANARVAAGQATPELVADLEESLPIFLGFGGESFTWSKRSRETLIRAHIALGTDAEAIEHIEALFSHQGYWDYDALCQAWDEALGAYTRAGRRADLFRLLERVRTERMEPLRSEKRDDYLAWGGRWLRRIGEPGLATAWDEALAAPPAEGAPDDAASD